VRDTVYAQVAEYWRDMQLAVVLDGEQIAMRQQVRQTDWIFRQP
jgi:hypothetical protein